MSQSHIDVSALSLLELTDWVKRHGSTVAAAQAAYDREHL
jgi:hypothetical protein